MGLLVRYPQPTEFKLGEPAPITIGAFRRRSRRVQEEGFATDAFIGGSIHDSSPREKLRGTRKRRNDQLIEVTDGRAGAIYGRHPGQRHRTGGYHQQRFNTGECRAAPLLFAYPFHGGSLLHTSLLLGSLTVVMAEALPGCKLMHDKFMQTIISGIRKRPYLPDFSAGYPCPFRHLSLA